MEQCEKKLTAAQLRESQLIKRIDGIGFLYPDFEDLINDLTMVIKQHQMPFKVYETYRTPLRQKKLISLGLSKLRDPMESKHVHGLAVDFLLDYRAVRSLKKSPLDKITESDINQKKSKISDDYGGVYNLGVNMIEVDGNAPRTQVKDMVVLDFWNYLGRLIERQFPDLVWGGRFNMKKGELIGTDPPHVEYRHAEKLMHQRRTIGALRASGNPGLEGVKI
jgi:hypothetical protein